MKRKQTDKLKKPMALTKKAKALIQAEEKKALKHCDAIVLNYSIRLNRILKIVKELYELV